MASDISSAEATILVIADIHYVHHAQHVCAIPERRVALGAELIRRVLRRIRRIQKPDAIVLLGDLCDNGRALRAEDDLLELRDALAGAGAPLIPVFGNHDADARLIAKVFGAGAGRHEIKGVRLFVFTDSFAADDTATRSPEAMAELAKAACLPSNGPLIVFQHNPVYPPIDNPYPYILEGAPAVMAAYARAGVALSVSGHYHPGQALCEKNGVQYVTCPALCEEPFGFLLITVKGAAARVQEDHLAMDKSPALLDVHAHTQYAYCAETVEARKNIERGRLLGLAGLALTEHAGQLYVAPDDFWSARFLVAPRIMRKNRAQGRTRMEQYQREIGSLRSDYVRLGLEVELDLDGQLTLLEEDRDFFDFLIGAVHWLPGREAGSLPDGELAREFLRVTERLLETGIAVLAHPLRLFTRLDKSRPRDLYGPLARLIAQSGKAAEINFHTDEPDPAFFARVLAEGGRIALGSDAHAIEEVGEFTPHLALLREAAGGADLSALRWYRPPARNNLSAL